jgi:hypothetical protein
MHAVRSSFAVALIAGRLVALVLASALAVLGCAGPVTPVRSAAAGSISATAAGARAHARSAMHSQRRMAERSARPFGVVRCR